MKNIINKNPIFSSIKNYGLSQNILNYFKFNNIHTTTEIQDKSFKNLLDFKNKGNYFLGAQTGSGKTFSYIIPEIERLKKLENKLGTKISYNNEPNILILAPSKELSNQIYNITNEICHYVKLSSNIIDSSVSFKKNLEKSDRKSNILISNLSIFNSLYKINRLRFNKLNSLIIDEADVFIDCGYSSILKSYIEKANEQDARVILVSATLTSSLNNFIKNNIGNQNIKFILSQKTHINLANIEQEFIKTNMDKKEDFIKVLKEINYKLKKDNSSCIVFCNSIDSVKYIDFLIKESGFESLSLHGDLKAKIRIYNYNLFKQRNVNILVTTDLGSRGLDFPFVDYVINFDFPKNTADYIHRIGRTGRNNKKGKSISFYNKKDNKQIIKELKDAHRTGNKLKIGNSNFFKINKEDLRDISKLGKTEEETLNIIKNTKQRMRLLPKDFVELENQQLKSKSTKIKNWKKEKEDIRIKYAKKLNKESKKLSKNEKNTSNKGKSIKKAIRRNIKGFMSEKRKNK